jgi:hypothetical protein
MLRDFRAVALVIGSAAVSIAGTAFGLYVFGIPANMLTLAGLAMGIGILVQNGLVVAERLGTVPDTREARADVAARITPAILGATLTTAVVLFPFLYLQGNARAAFMPFAAAFTMALAWSVVASVVMIPALASGHHIHETAWRRSRRLYARLLFPVIRFRWVTIASRRSRSPRLTWVFIKKVPRFVWRIRVRPADLRGGDDRLPAVPTRHAGQRYPRWKRRRRQPGVEQVRSRSNGITGAVMNVMFTREHELTAIPLEMEERLTQRAVFIGGASVSVRGQGPGFSSGYGSSSMASYRIRVMGYSFSGVEQMALDVKDRLEQIPRVRKRGHQHGVRLHAGEGHRRGDRTRSGRAGAIRPDGGGPRVGRGTGDPHTGRCTASGDRWRRDSGERESTRRQLSLARGTQRSVHPDTGRRRGANRDRFDSERA